VVKEERDHVTIEQIHHITTALMVFLQSTVVIETKDLWVTVRVAIITFNINQNQLRLCTIFYRLQWLLSRGHNLKTANTWNHILRLWKQM